DNFFNLGGHSLLAMRVVNAIRVRFKAEIVVRDVFAHPILKDLGLAVRGAEESRQELIPKVKHGGLLVPLSYAQQRLWFLSQTEGGSRAYHVPFGVELRGSVDVEALCRALDRIVERHEALRTTFEQVEGEPRQRVREAEPFRLVQEDVRECADPKLAVRERAEVEVSEAFDLEHGPVIRGRLVRHGEEEYTLLVTIHHIASDGWSMGIFLRELSELYGAFCRGEADPLAGLPVQYADYAVWQRSEAAAGKLEKQAKYWERALEGAPTVLELPMDRPRPAQQEYAGGAVRIELDAELTKGLKRLSQRAGTTLFMTVLGGWMAVLGRLARQEDVVVGTPVSNRGHEQIEGLIGFFVNALALRVEVRGELRVRELLERVKRCALEGQQNQEIPFEQVVERVRPERSLAHSPIFQTVFTWQNNEGGRTLNLPGIEVGASEAVVHGVSKFDLILSVREKGEVLTAVLEYATSLFDEVTVRRMIGYLRTMLAGMVEDEGREIGSIGLLTGEERQLVLQQWNDTQALYPAVCAHQLVEQQAQRTPHATAVIFQQESLTYAELNSRANQLAHFLIRKGVRPGCRVALCVERGLPMVVGVLGAIKAGGAYVPLDPAYPRRHLAGILRDADPEVVLVDRAGQAVLAGEVAKDKLL
ncbi:MAG TPA: condensation domain-containing protein, partial [Gemmatimonadales bacterium]|nr:condensation domain-containing protein [Gemmatimonadales bacterium]